MYKIIMKNTPRVLTALCLFLTVNFISAQVVDGYERNFDFAVGLNAGLPLNDPYDVNLGMDARIQYNISESYSLCFTAGVNNLLVENQPNFTYMPIKVGYKTFLFKNEFYVMGEIGGAFSITEEYDNNSMMFCPSIGYASKIVDVSLRYEFLKDFPIIKDGVPDNGLANLMVRVAYAFDL